MSIYFDFKTINELTGYNCYRQQKEFTLEELSKYNGSNGRPAYVAIEGVVYDVSNQENWDEGMDYGLTAGEDLSEQLYSCHGISQILKNAPKVGTLLDDEYMDDMDGMSNMNSYSNKTMNRQVDQQDTSKFTPDDWIRYITPLVTYALREPSQGKNSQRIYQKAILMGVLVGLGRRPQEAINQVEQWENSGESQLLNNGTGVGTTGGMGTTTGTVGGIGTPAGTGVGTGTIGGMGTAGGLGTGLGTTGTGVPPGTGTMGSGLGTGVGTGIAGGIGPAAGPGIGTGGMGTAGGIGTGIGTTGGIGTGTTGGIGTGRETGGSTSTSSNTGTGNRLIFDE